MIKHLKLLLFISIGLWLVLSSCAGFKKSKPGRMHNNLTARYNGFFNARELVKATELQTKDNHVDDFTMILPIYRWGDEITGKANTPDMDKAIEKCSKVIRDHDGSNWIDDSYYTVARAYFFKADYYAALDLFKYLASEHKGKEMEPLARLWIVQTYIQMDKLDDALAYLSNCQNDRKKFEPHSQQLNLLNAHLKIMVNNYSEAIISLKKAVENEKKKKERYRQTFILGQLYEETGNKRKANELYSSLMKKNMPYEFQFQTRIRVAKSSNLKNKEEAEKVIKGFRRLLKDDNNREYFDQIFYEIAQIYEESGDDGNAIKNYKKAAWLGTKNMSQKANTYLALGELYFEKESFENSGKYFDSCAQIVPTIHPKYEEIKKQQSLLVDLIMNLQTIKENDSLLGLALLEPMEVEKIVDKKIADEAALKEKQEEQEALRERREERNESLGESSLATNPGLRNTSSDWYFYNAVAMQRGTNDFERKFGKRPLEDNWRRSQKVFSFSGQEESAVDSSEQRKLDSLEAAALTEKLPEELNEQLINMDKEKLSYFNNIPYLPSQKLLANESIAKALYANGLIYFEQLSDYKSAITSFQRLVTEYPKDNNVPAAHYYLCKLFEQSQQTDLYEANKAVLINKFPETQYAALIINGGKAVDDIDVELERTYQLAYSLYQNGNCDSLRWVSNRIEKEKKGNYLMDRFEFLSTLCAHKDRPSDTLIFALNRFLKKYPVGGTSSEARNIIRYLTEKKEEEKNIQTVSDSAEIKQESLIPKFRYTYSDQGDFYFIISSTDKKQKSDKLKSELANYNIKYHRTDALTVRTIELKNNETIYWVRSFKSLQKVQKYMRGLESDEEFDTKLDKSSANMYYVTPDNFKLLIKEQNSKEYIDFFEWYFVEKEN